MCGVKAQTFQVDGIQSVERKIGADGVMYAEITYYTLARPPSFACERRTNSVTLIVPIPALNPDGRIVQWIKQQEGSDRLHS